MEIKSEVRFRDMFDAVRSIRIENYDIHNAVFSPTALLEVELNKILHVEEKSKYGKMNDHIRTDIVLPWGSSVITSYDVDYNGHKTDMSTEYHNKKGEMLLYRRGYRDFHRGFSIDNLTWHRRMDSAFDEGEPIEVIGESPVVLFPQHYTVTEEDGRKEVKYKITLEGKLNMNKIW